VTKSPQSGERKILRNPESNPRTLDQWADTLATVPRRFVAVLLQCMSQGQNVVVFNAVPNFLVTRLHQFNKV